MDDMEFLYDLCDHIKRTLKKVTADVSQMNRTIDPNEAQYIDYLAHAWKSLDCVKEMEGEGGASSRGSGTYDWEGGGSHADGGASGKRGRMNAKRDSMGRYASDSGASYGHEADEMIRAIDNLKSMIERRG